VTCREREYLLDLTDTDMEGNSDRASLSGSETKAAILKFKYKLRMIALC